MNLAGRSVSVPVAVNENVVCTFNNQRQAATLQLVKKTTGGDGTFSFTSVELSNPSLTTVSGTAQTAANLVVPGTYTLTEATVAGWDLTAVACTGNASAATVNLASRTVSVPVAANENVICTFNNRKSAGTLQLVKRTAGGDGIFAFTSMELGNPSLATVSGTAQTAATAVEPGTYTIAEAASAGWDLTAIACVGNTAAATVNLAGRNVSVPVGANENVICTFNNRRQASLRITKQAVGGNGAFGFSGSGGIGTFSLVTASGTANRLFNNLAAGNYTLSEADAPGWTLAGIACSGATATVDLAARAVVVALGAGQAAECTFTNTEVKNRTEAVIRDFMVRRADAITANGPRADRMVDRLSQSDTPAERGSIKDDASHRTETHRPMKLGGGASCDGPSAPLDPVHMLRADPGDVAARSAGTDCGSDRRAIGTAPVAASGSGDETQGRLAFAGSLSKLGKSVSNRDADKVPLGAGAAGYKGRFDIWTEGTYVYMDSDKSSVTGHFGMVSGGIDYLLRPGLLVGAMIQFDTASERSQQLAFEIKGTGWMAGPYAGVRLSPHLFLDGRAMWGRSSNEVSPFLSYTDHFDTTRWLLSARLTGRWTNGAWTFSPSAEVIKFQETSTSYTDSLGIMIDSQKIDLGRVIFGPEVSYAFRRADGLSIVPRLALRGIWDFETPGVSGLDGTGIGHGQDQLRARIEAGVGLTDTAGRRLDISGAYDGVGADDTKAISGKARVTLPF